MVIFAPEATNMSKHQKNVIVYADDDIDDIELLKEAFADLKDDVEVIAFQDGAQTLQYLNKLSPDEPSPCLIILDINMPVIGGKETLSRLRNMRRFAETPIVLFSTSSQPHDKEFARSYNAGFITKPPDFKQLAKIADQFIDHCDNDVKNSLRKVAG